MQPPFTLLPILYFLSASSSTIFSKHQRDAINVLFRIKNADHSSSQFYNKFRLSFQGIYRYVSGYVHDDKGMIQVFTNIGHEANNVSHNRRQVQLSETPLRTTSGGQFLLLLLVLKYCKLETVWNIILLETLQIQINNSVCLDPKSSY